jgi:hypothetical protein
MRIEFFCGSLVGLLLVGCSAREDTASVDGPGGAPRAVPTPLAESVVATCAAGATLYPKARMTDLSTRDAVVGKQWARRDGGQGSMHGPPELWRRNTDLRLEHVEGVIRMTYKTVIESSHEDPRTTTIAKDCQICGAVLVCDQAVWTLATRTNAPPDGDPLEVLAMDAAVELGDHDLYLVRHGHEVYLDFGADPRTTARGTLEIRVRKLERGAPVTAESTTFVAEPMAVGYAGRRVKVTLPGVDAIGVEFRPDRSPDGGGYGTDTTIEPTLYELESLKRNPKLMQQPQSLDIAADAPGFNLPHN